MIMTQSRRIHPAVLDAASDLRKGKISRRDFFRFAALLGTSATMAYAVAGCAPAAPGAAPGGAASSAPAAASGAAKRGGTWTSAMLLQRIDHPARLSWLQGGNVVRQVSEY